VTRTVTQFAEGMLLGEKGNGEVSVLRVVDQPKSDNLIPPTPLTMLSYLGGILGELCGLNLAASITSNCDSVSRQGQLIGERGGSLARRRYQKGRVFLRGIKNPKWIGRWREDVIENGQIRRIERSEVLGSKSDFPTKRLALRELEKRLSVVNNPRYRARPTATFEEFASGWESRVLTQHKPSTQATIKSHLRKHLVPYFGRTQMKDIGTEEVQTFIASLRCSPKTVKNIHATMQMLWKSARVWNYVAHDAVSDVILPKRNRVARRFFSVEEVQRVLASAPEPYHTFYWLAVETGMRAGELCGLRESDFDVERGLVSIRQSVWRGEVQSPKSENAIRCFALSRRLLAHIVEYLKRWTPNDRGLLFVTRNGTPWDANLLVKRKLYPLLDSLGIERGGLHAFRHTNSTLMDRLSAPLKLRQERMGHSDPSLTLGAYTHVDGEDDVRFVEQLDAILRPNAPKSKKERVASGGQPFWN
jgi:integrase